MQPSNIWPICEILRNNIIQLLESPIGTTTTATTTTPAMSQKASSGDVSGTKRGIIDPLVSKRPEKFWIRKLKKNTLKMV